MQTFVKGFKDFPKLGVFYAMLGNVTRDFIIEHKGLFCKALIAFARVLPEPTKETTVRPNTHRLLDVKDEFFEHEDNPGREEVLRAIWKIGTVIYEHDIYYSNRVDWVVEKIANGNWVTRPCGHPNTHWNEPEPYGGGHLIKDETLIANEKRFKQLEALCKVQL